MQAAILRARLTFLPEWTARRRALGKRYRAALAGTQVEVPPECDAGHVYHLFPVLSNRRDEIRAHLEGRGIGTLIHYPVPVTRQAAFANLVPTPCPVADRVCRDVFSLPLHPQLSDADADEVADALRRWPHAGPSPAR
jgi:dTDP-4-amino-4,6-dideoxygalactose transaminase